MAASAAVFNTFELCEAVLLELPVCTLGTVVLVCKTWRDTVKRSTRLPSTTPLGPVYTRDKVATYDVREDFITHPDLPSSKRYPRHLPGSADRPSQTIEVQRIWLDRNSLTADLERAGPQDFVTMPPIKHLHAQSDGYAKPARLSVKGGIRLSHVRALDKTYGRYGIHEIGFGRRSVDEQASPMA